MDHELRQELRQAERDGNHQRLYTLLQRAGQPDEAQKLFLSHPIQVDCIVQYRYRITWFVGNYNDPGEERDTAAFDLDALVEKFIAVQVGACQIRYISRNPVYRLLGDELEVTSAWQKPLPSITLKEEDTQVIKDRVRSHPQYMKRASAEQLEEAREADEADAERARRHIEAERRSVEAEQRRNQLEVGFQRDSTRLYDEVLALWAQHRDLPRPQFAREVRHHSLRCVLFRLKDFQAVNHELVTTAVLKHIWAEMEPKRFSIYRRPYQESQSHV